ncbi:MAG: amino acid permease [Clostridium sp.]|uniref:amino acid permease n=1 Tax=Clostridium sp. TaxID=1506 RepID=UPI0030238784
MSKKDNLLKEDGKLKRELGLGAATAIVVGNIIGSGIFMSPASFARVTNPKVAILAWILTSIGSLLIALSFANLGSKMPKTGGPIVYTRAAFGDFAGFLIAWSFWIGAWVGNAAIITAFMSYFTYFVPAANNPLAAFLISSAVVWIFTLINIFGVKYVGKIGIVSTIIKVAVLVVFIVIAGLNFDPSYMKTISSPEVSGMGTLPAAIAIALWAFVGLESATVAGGEIKDPEKNIRKSTIYGIVIVSVIYIIMSVVSMGAIDQATLASSDAPLADIINKVTGGTWGGMFIAAGALVSTLGATCGWLLTTARSAVGAAEDGLFPPIFKRISPRFNTPVASIVIGSICMNLLLIMNYVGSLQSAFDFMILLATLSFLPAYTFSAAAEIVLLCKGTKDFNFINFLKSSFFSILAFAYSIYAIYGTGSDVVMYGFILMLLGIPIYVYMMLQKNKDDKKVDKLREAAGIELE